MPEKTQPKLVFEELTGEIRQIAFEVHSYFGNGFLEKVYENAMVNRLRKSGLDVKQQATITILDFDGYTVGEYYADILVNDSIIIEMKAAKAIAPEHESQLLHYLKATNKKVGLLINFGSTRLEFKRFVLG
ncbi:MAG: GxxExxY protein [Planctomycetes bacterium]|nr:GxxExxY protein [Planctomycetota bacterium]